MRVFKFGGASVVDAKSVENLKKIITQEGEDLVIIVSAMGKSTNKLEAIWEAKINEENEKADIQLNDLIKYHENIYTKLSLADDQSFLKQFHALLQELNIFLKTNYPHDVSFYYDQIVCYGELFSTSIISSYLNKEGIKNTWLDARKLIKTSDHFQEARVNWGKSKKLIQEEISDLNKTYISQGFIGSNSTNQTTTLGREGSDYSAAIFAWAINASEVVIWKDVKGLLNADPKLFENTIQLKNISFKEAIELSYLGASVIHPKTIKPLQNKGIPLIIKSFLDLNQEGSSIQDKSANDNSVPSYIYKPNQILLSISTKDYSFIFEDHLSDLFRLFAENGLKVHLMQNSALSFSVCGFIKIALIPRLLEALSLKYLVKYNERVDLLTIRHYQDFKLPKLVEKQEVLLEQRSRSTIRYVLKKGN